jgi:hypothetical protein
MMTKMLPRLTVRLQGIPQNIAPEPKESGLRLSIRFNGIIRSVIPLPSMPFHAEPSDSLMNAANSDCPGPSLDDEDDEDEDGEILKQVDQYLRNDNEKKAQVSNRSYVTNVADWTCTCGRQKYDRHHLCKHLVQAVEPLHPRFWREVIRRRVKPIYQHPSLIAKGDNLPAITLSRDPGTISDGDDHIGTVQYRKSYLPWKEVFEQKAAERFPGKRPWDHAIELRDDFKPKKGKIYPLNPLQQNTLDEWIKEQLAKGYIRPSKSPQASPFFFVEKKDAKKLRPCQDYRYLNEFTKPNAYPLPLISDLMITLKGSKFFTKLDIRWGYNNVGIKEGDEWKAAFITKKGLFGPTVMFFGLQNSPATFQAMMDDYFRDMIDEGWIAIYMDDILIHARTKEDLEKRTK